MQTHLVLRATLTLGFAALLTTMLSSPLAYGDTVEVTPFWNLYSVIEGQSLLVDFSVANNLAVPITITSYDESGISTIGDFSDYITGGYLVTSSCPTPVPAGGACAFQWKLFTPDPSDDTDSDFGVSHVSFGIEYTPQGGTPTSAWTGEIAVFVNDPVPEPSSLLLLSAGLTLGCCVLRRRR
jgi:hypothetical protein